MPEQRWRSKLKKRKKKEIQVSKGTLNVFADLGLPHPKLRLAKANIAICLEHCIDRAQLTEKQAARRLRVSESDLKEILRGNLKYFKLFRLIKFLMIMEMMPHAVGSPLAPEEP